MLILSLLELNDPIQLTNPPYIRLLFGMGSACGGVDFYSTRYQLADQQASSTTHYHETNMGTHATH